MPIIPIIIRNGVATITSLTLAELVGRQHQVFVRQHKKNLFRICGYQFFNNEKGARFYITEENVPVILGKISSLSTEERRAIEQQVKSAFDSFIMPIIIPSDPNKRIRISTDDAVFDGLSYATSWGTRL